MHDRHACLILSGLPDRCVCFFFKFTHSFQVILSSSSISRKSDLCILCVSFRSPISIEFVRRISEREKKTEKKYKEFNGSIRWNAGHYATIRFFNPFFSEQTMARFHVYNFLCVFCSHFSNRNQNSQNNFKPKRTTAVYLHLAANNWLHNNWPKVNVTAFCMATKPQRLINYINELLYTHWFQ